MIVISEISLCRFVTVNSCGSILIHRSRNMTKPTKRVCAQQKLRSSWASAQSDQSLLWRNLGSLATHWVHSENSDQAGRCPGWSESLLGTQSFYWFCHEVAHRFFSRKIPIYMYLYTWFCCWIFRAELEYVDPRIRGWGVETLQESKHHRSSQTGMVDCIKLSRYLEITVYRQL